MLQLSFYLHNNFRRRSETYMPGVRLADGERAAGCALGCALQQTQTRAACQPAFPSPLNSAPLAGTWPAVGLALCITAAPSRPLWNSMASLLETASVANFSPRAVATPARRYDAPPTSPTALVRARRRPRRVPLSAPPINPFITRVQQPGMPPAPPPAPPPLSLSALHLIAAAALL